MQSTTAVINRARDIKLLILDVDGVLTDGSLWFCPEGVEYKAFHSQDGLGLKRLQQLTSVNIAIISGRASSTVEYRMKQLQIEHVFLGYSEKVPVFHDLLTTLTIAPEHVAYVGDDLPDLEVMQLCGLNIAVNNAVAQVKEYCHCITTRNGGQGAVREVCDLLITAQS